MQTVVEVPLSVIYAGGTVQIEVEKNVICEDCSGTGAEDPKYVVLCEGCGGKGMKIIKQMIAPGFFQQVQTTCDRCGGAGKMIKKPCNTCQGHKVHREKVQHDVHIPEGMPLNGQYVIENEADESPDWEPGDLILTIQESGNAALNGGFRRRGIDMFVDISIGVHEALGGGFEHIMTHLDGRTIMVGRGRGKIIQPGTLISRGKLELME
jgi:DnaJ-related protein SCJ1